MNVEESIDYLKIEIARARFVTRKWQVYSDLGLQIVTVRFLFMCPCGNDIVERVSFPHPDGANHFDHVVRGTLKVLLRELEGHISNDDGRAQAT